VAIPDIRKDEKWSDAYETAKAGGKKSAIPEQIGLTSL
jgi:hypothetical protein